MASPWHKLSGAPEIRSMILQHVFDPITVIHQPRSGCRPRRGWSPERHILWEPDSDDEDAAELVELARLAELDGPPKENPWLDYKHRTPHLNLILVSHSFVDAEEVYYALFSVATLHMNEFHLQNPADQGLSRRQAGLVRSLQFANNLIHYFLSTSCLFSLNYHRAYLPNLKTVVFPSPAICMATHFPLEHLESVAQNNSGISDLGRPEPPRHDSRSCSECNDLARQNLGAIVTLMDYNPPAKPPDWRTVCKILKDARMLNIEVKFHWTMICRDSYLGPESTREEHEKGMTEASVSSKDWVLSCQYEGKEYRLFQKTLKDQFERELSASEP